MRRTEGRGKKRKGKVIGEKKKRIERESALAVFERLRMQSYAVIRRKRKCNVRRCSEERGER